MCKEWKKFKYRQRHVKYSFMVCNLKMKKLKHRIITCCNNSASTQHPKESK